MSDDDAQPTLDQLAAQGADQAEAARRLESCTGKERFTSQGVARAVASRRTRQGKPASPYRCDFCGGFHIGLDWKRKF